MKKIRSESRRQWTLDMGNIIPLRNPVATVSAHSALAVGLLWR